MSSIDHYENFPVASLLLPKRYRAAVAHIYAFARSADDLADEGQHAPAERLAALEQYTQQLNCIATGQPLREPLFVNLGHTICQHRLPIELFHDLLSAFKQDVVVQRYATFDQLLDYCRRSANPVGRLLLALYQKDHDAKLLQQSDCICSALQLINFWQDVAIDLAKPRIYLPQEDLQGFGVSEAMLHAQKLNPQWRALMAFQVQRSRAMMLQGAPLVSSLPGRVGFELRLVVQGGLRILEKIEQLDYDIFSRRPVLRAWDWIRMVLRGVIGC